jgi:hypothetical protein
MALLPPLNGGTPVDGNDRQMIDGLFDRLRQVEAQRPARDAEAEAYIRRRVEELPTAPYYLAQTVLVQEQALAAAQERVRELEAEVARRPAGGGFLDSFLAPARPTRGSRLPLTAPPRAAQLGGGFMAGAMQTALGVAGGILAAQAISSAFGAGTAEAAAPPEPPPLDESFGDAGFVDESW